MSERKNLSKLLWLFRIVKSEVKKFIYVFLVDAKVKNDKGKAKTSPSPKPKSRFLPLYNLQVALEMVRLFASIVARPDIGGNIVRPTLRIKIRSWSL